MPRPPPSQSTADFIVTVFALTVSATLVLLSAGIVIAAFKGGDVKSYFSILTTIVTSIISALVGYLAGKGQSKPGDPEGPA